MFAPFPPSSAGSPASLPDRLFLATTKPKDWVEGGNVLWEQGRHGGRVVDSCGQRSEQDTATCLGIQTKILSSAITILDVYRSSCMCVYVCVCMYMCVHLMRAILMPGLSVSERWGPEQ